MKIFLKTLKYFFILLLFILTFLRVFVIIVPYDDAVSSISEASGVEEGAFAYDDPYDKGIYIFTYIYHNTYADVYAFSVIFAFLSVIILYRGRTLFEVLFLLNFLAIPKQRKGWGTVYDADNRQPISLSVIRLFKQLENGGLLQVTQGVSDFDGKYSLIIDSIETKHILMAKAVGYEQYQIELEVSLLKFMGTQLVNDIPMQRYVKQTTLLRNFYKLRPKFYIYLINFIFIFSLINFIRGLYGVYLFPQVVNFADYSIYVVGFFWNIYVMTLRHKSDVGRVLDENTNQPIFGMTIEINSKNGVKKYQSDNEGMVVTGLPKGTYDGNILTETPQSIKVKINEKGMLANNIKITAPASIQASFNPFA